MANGGRVMTRTLIRKYWWLALIAGGWLLAHQAHADPYTDAAKTLADASAHFDGELLKMRKACVAAVVTWNASAKFKNIAAVFGKVGKFDRSKPDIMPLIESDVQLQFPSCRVGDGGRDLQL